MKTSRILSAISFAIIVFGQGCSGKFAPIGSDQDASVQGGNSGTGGSTGVTCLYNNVHYAVGASFKSSDGCNNCSCSSNGQALCTLMACVGTGGGSGVGGSTSSGCVCAGPSPESPTFQCWDGSTAGPTCVTNATGSCNWQVTTCPPQPGVGGSTGAGGTTGTSGCVTVADCKGALPALCQQCSDGISGCAHFVCNSGSCNIAYCGAADASTCPPILLVIPVCANGSAVLKYDASGCATGYVCP